MCLLFVMHCALLLVIIDIPSYLLHQVLDHGGLQGLKEFHNEMALSRSIQHPHVVRLLGYAAEGGTQCLVYELMSQGNLEDRLACKVRAFQG